MEDGVEKATPKETLILRVVTLNMVGAVVVAVGLVVILGHREMQKAVEVQYMVQEEGVAVVGVTKEILLRVAYGEHTLLVHLL